MFKMCFIFLIWLLCILFVFIVESNVNLWLFCSLVFQFVCSFYYIFACLYVRGDVVLSFSVDFWGLYCIKLSLMVDVYGGVGLFFDVLLFKCAGWYVSCFMRVYIYLLFLLVRLKKVLIFSVNVVKLCVVCLHVFFISVVAGK